MKSNNLVRKNSWIIGPWRDSIFFILTPLLIIPAMSLLQLKFNIVTLSNFILAYGSLGHHLPGLIRVYTEPDLFQRFKARFILAPIVFLSTCALFSYYNFNGLGFIIIMWGTWHGAMQVNGFLRIYDSKVKSFAKITARLDWWMCLFWFGSAIWHSNVKMSSILGHFYGSGGHLLSPQGFKWFQISWDVVTAIITSLFILNLIIQWKKGNPISLLKIVSLISSFGFWWYCMVSVNNLLLGLAMWEIFHDFQYNAIVWVFNRKRVDGKLPTSIVERFLFQPRWSKMALYLGLVFAYGHLGVMTSYVNIHIPSELLDEKNLSVWLTRLMMASGFLHFYFDGFIWKIRDSETQKGLTIHSEQNPISPKKTSSISHLLKWGLFVIPVFYLGIAQSNHWESDAKSQHLNMSQMLPDSWYAQFMAASLYKAENAFEFAAPYFENAVNLKPEFAPGYLLLADVYYRLGKYDRASQNYRKAVELEPENLEAQLNLANLYLEIQKPHEALQHFQAAHSLHNSSQITIGIATSLMKLQRLDEAKPYILETLQLFPRHGTALYYLGLLSELKMDSINAIKYYTAALEADSTIEEARKRMEFLKPSPQ